MSTQIFNALGRSTAAPQVRDRAKPSGLRQVSMEKVVTPIPGKVYTSPGGGPAPAPALKVINPPGAPTPAPVPPANTAAAKPAAPTATPVPTKTVTPPAPAASAK